MYAKGQGVTPDDKLAFEYFKLAADQGMRKLNVILE